jgi:signal recognition particle receptor subunit beta
VPFVVGVNCFDDAQPYLVDDVRSALDIDESIPLVLCDARQRASSKTVLVTLLEYLIQRAMASASN